MRVKILVAMITHFPDMNFSFFNVAIADHLSAHNTRNVGHATKIRIAHTDNVDIEAL